MDEKILKIGEKAPKFSLIRQDGKVTRLEDFRGKWVVLYFYPKDDTPGCTIEALDFTRDLDEFESLNAVVCGIGPDSTESHCRFIEKHGLRVMLLSDLDHAISEMYGVWRLKKMYDREYFGVYRSTFIINPEGEIAHSWYGLSAEGHVEEVKRKLKELQN